MLPGLLVLTGPTESNIFQVHRNGPVKYNMYGNAAVLLCEPITTVVYFMAMTHI